MTQIVNKVWILKISQIVNECKKWTEEEKMDEEETIYALKTERCVFALKKSDEGGRGKKERLEYVAI